MFDWLFGRNKEEEKKVFPENFHGTQSALAPQAQEVVGPSLIRTESVSVEIDTKHLESQLEDLGRQMARLVDQATRLQDQLDRLDHQTSFGNAQLETLTRHLSDIADWTDPLDKRLAELATWAEQSQAELTQLEESIRRLSRTQFKANSLAESQQERLQSALDLLREMATRKQEEVEKARQQQLEAVEVARREARVALAVDLFPVLDGLESALESGRALLRRGRPRTVESGFLARLAYAFGLRDLPMGTGQHQPGLGDTQALAAWLDGLELVRERFLALLQAEGIQPIRAEGKPFDPHLHVAVEAVERSDVPPGTVVEEHRPGYRLGNRVLRYAEVVVTRDGAGPSSQEMEAEKVPVSGSEITPPEERHVESWQEVQAGPEGEVETEAGPGELEQDGQRDQEVGEGQVVAGAETMWGEVSQGPDEELETVAGEAQPEAETAEPDVEEEPDEASGEHTENTTSSQTEERTRPLDPEIEELIARFEARHQPRQS